MQKLSLDGKIVKSKILWDFARGTLRVVVDAVYTVSFTALHKSTVQKINKTNSRNDH